MKENITLLLLFSFLGFIQAQNITELELTEFAADITTTIGEKMNGHNILIDDFVDSSGDPSDLGKYLSEELSYTLTQNNKNIKVVDRNKYDNLIDEAKKGEGGITKSTKIQELGHIENITAIVYGKLLPVGNYLIVYAKVVTLSSQTNEVTVKGKLTRTPTIDGLMGLEREKLDVTSTGTSQELTSTSSTNSYINNHIQIAVNNCKRNGNYTDCELQITSQNRGDNFTIKKNQTRLMGNNGKTYAPNKIYMNNKSSSVQLNQPLRANSPAIAVLRFYNIPQGVNNISTLQIDCHSTAAFSFIAQLQNIRIQ